MKLKQSIKINWRREESKIGEDIYESSSNLTASHAKYCHGGCSHMA